MDWLLNSSLVKTLLHNNYFFHKWLPVLRIKSCYYIISGMTKIADHKRVFVHAGEHIGVEQ